MRKCICFCHNLNTCTISLMVDNKLVYTHSGEIELGRYLNGTSIDELDVIIKPSIAKTIPEDGFRLGEFSQDGASRVCVISENDITNLVEVSKLFEIPNVKVFNYLDVVSSKFSNHDKVIVLIEWVDSTTALVYLEFGVIKAFKLSAESKLSYNISRFRDKYKCAILEDSNVYDFIGLRNKISNSSNINTEDREAIMHIPYVLDLKGVSIINNQMSLNMDDEEDGDDDDEDNNQPNPNVHKEQPKKKKKSFFAGLFRKKSKDELLSKNKFSKYDDDFKREMELYKTSYNENSTFYSNVGTIGYESDVLVVRERSVGDYLFYAIIFIISSCMVLSFVFSSVYKTKMKSLADNNQEIQSYISEMKSSEQYLDKHPSSKIVDLASTELPDGCEMSTIRYEGGDVLEVEIASDGTLSDELELSNSLSNDLYVSDINKIDSSVAQNQVINSAITYALTLVIP